MALFGKKKKAEPTAPQPNAEDEIQVAGADADEVDFDQVNFDEADIEEDGDGQVIDFDAIADELGDDDGESEMGEPLGGATDGATSGAPLNLSKPTSAEADAFATDAAFDSGNAGLDADDELDFDSVFDDGSTATATPAAVPDTDENPFGASSGGAPIDGTPIDGAPDDGIAIEPVSDTPPLTHTAPLLTSDAVATSGVPATRRSLPILPLLGAAGLLAALGVVGYLVFGGNSAPEEELVVATNPALQAPASDNGENVVPDAPVSVPAPGQNADAVNPGIAVDGVPIAPGPIVRTATDNVGPRPTVPLTPSLLNQLKILWKRGAAAKQKGDYAGARVAWEKMLQLRPNHPRVQSAIDKLPTT